MGNKGRHWKLSELAKKHIGDAVRGRKLSEETKEKLKASWTLERRKEYGKTHSGKNNHFFGKTWTLEHREKIKETKLKTMASWSPDKIKRVMERRKIMNSPHPTCQKCGKIIRRHNKTGMCKKHKTLSVYVKERAKKHYQENREEICRKNNEYNTRPEVKARKQAYDIEYRKRNAKKIDERVLQWRKNRLLSDALFKMKEMIKHRIYLIFKTKRIEKPKQCIQLLGTDILTVRNHIEKQFMEGMSWENYKWNVWHIDHIIPLSSAKTKDELIKLCYYTNLQPLWALDNLRKSAKIQQ